MKELSIKQKAEAYDEAIERAKSLLSDNQLGNAWIYKVLPELKESEDEKIRKNLITCISTLKHPLFSEKERKEFIAWLEKQTTPQVRTGLEWENTIDDACDARYTEEYSHDEYCHEQSFKWGFKEGVDWLEKQGEHTNFLDKIQIGDKVTRNKDGVLVNLSQLNRVAKKDEKQGGQKPANKIEPKFHEGDWILHQGTDIIYQVVAVIDDKYRLKCGDNYTTQNCADVERCARLWDITKDAKDGDVLLSPSTPEGDKECPFIFKEIDKSGIVRFHVALLQSESIKIADGITNNMGYANAGYHTPATKEQRDLLFTKMKEAGYEWDAENKQLKKIEEKSSWNEEDRIRIANCIQLIGKTGDGEVEWLKSLESRILPQTKPEWSEEDEKKVNNLCVFLDQMVSFVMLGNKDATEFKDWLKSLKYRVQSQSKQEWSKEDERAFSRICGIIHHAAYQNCDTDEYGNELGEYAKIINWFKSLKDRYAWKPSVEQIKAVRLARSFVIDDLDEHPTLSETLIELEEQLKKLRGK